MGPISDRARDPPALGMGSMWKKQVLQDEGPNHRTMAAKGQPTHQSAANPRTALFGGSRHHSAGSVAGLTPPTTRGATSTRPKQQVQTAIWHFQCEIWFVLTHDLSFWTEWESEQPFVWEHGSHCGPLGHRGKRVQHSLLFAQRTVRPLSLPVPSPVRSMNATFFPPTT